MTADASPSPADPTPTPAPRRRRRWWRLSVRGLMLLILVVGGLIGWEANRVGRMRRAVAVLHRAVEVPAGEHHLGLVIHFVGADQPSDSKVQVTFDDESADEGRVAAWLKEAVGRDHFRRVAGLEFERRPAAADWDAIDQLGSVRELEFDHVSLRDDDLRGLDRCPGLHHLALFNTEVTDAAMPSVATLRDLRTLDLRLTEVTAAGLAPLAGLTRLEELRLSSGAGTDAGLAHLRGMANLRVLEAGGFEAAVTDAGLAHLRGMARLEELEFEARRVSDAGMAILASLPRLKALKIGSASPDVAEAIRLSPAGTEQIGRLTHLERLELSTLFATDDAWLAAIGRLAALRELSVAGMRITDAGLAPLGALTRLEKLRIAGPSVTDAGLAALRPLTRLANLSCYARVTDAGLATLRSALPTLQRVRTDSWIDNGVNDLVPPAPPQPIDFGQLLRPITAPAPVAPARLAPAP